MKKGEHYGYELSLRTKDGWEPPYGILGAYYKKKSSAIGEGRWLRGRYPERYIGIVVERLIITAFGSAKNTGVIILQEGMIDELP